MPNGSHSSVLIPRPPDSDTVVLYHGTPKYYEGPPTRGDKDVLKTGYPSMSGNPEAADFFGGGGRDSRIYSVEIPKDRILDFTKGSQRWSKAGAWGPVRKKIEDAGKKGEYDAIAIHDVTFGSDEPEYRLLRAPNPDDWHVGPTTEHVENFAETDDIVRRFRAGEPITTRERAKARGNLRRDANYEEDSIDLDDGLMDDPMAFHMGENRPAIEARLARDRTMVQALTDNVPPDRMESLREAVASTPNRAPSTLALPHLPPQRSQREPQPYSATPEYRSASPQPTRAPKRRGRGLRERLFKNRR